MSRAGLTIYDFGRTTFYASRFDQRFAYCLYVPRDYEENGSKTYHLAITVHGTGRNATGYRDNLADFADASDCIILAPLFPAGIVKPGDLSGYKLISSHGIRYDHVLLSMVDEVAEKYRVKADRFLLYGFSGGGHFTHRFFTLHPERLLAASIGAPGVVTLLDQTRDWWVGVRNIEAVFGKALDIQHMREVAVQMVIGEEDTETWEITIRPGSSWWMEDANMAGETRIDRINALRESYEAEGIAVRLDTVPGTAHDPDAVMGPVRRFFAEVLRGR
ncbi:MAG: alpha/beta hydrolase [Pseudomonadota bacterium]